MIWRLLGITLAFIIGCNAPKPLENETNPAVAMSSLQSGLSTWHQGEQAATLSTRTPPIQFSDDDWVKGRKLEKFEMGALTPVGIGMRVPVTLTLRENNGALKVRKIHYRIYTSPAIAIGRDEN